MTNIYKLCTACLGEGKVENLTPEHMKVTIKESGLHEEPTVLRKEEECYVCHGDGVIPTGFFTLTADDKKIPILELIRESTVMEIKAIINRT